VPKIEQDKRAPRRPGHRLRKAAASAVGLYLELVLRSTRWTLEGEAHLAPYLAGGAVIVAVWHERLPVIPAFWASSRRQHPGRQVAALASRHRDGQFVAGVLARFGVRTVHGSSARARPGGWRDHGGASALRGLLAALAAGDAVVITPDGPRGPRRVAAPGVAQLAGMSGAPVLAVAGQVRHRITLGSWDRMVIPLPWGRGALVCAPPLHVPPEDAAVCLGLISAAMDEAAARADALCGA
jgi:lysophospholipid acyltransferase (LPLAT)-like uncharacterized protein